MILPSERETRRPDAVPGMPIRLSDGVEWVVPALVAELHPLVGSAGLELVTGWRVQGRGFDSQFDNAYRLALADLEEATENGESFEEELALASGWALQLQANYKVDTPDALVLVRYGFLVRRDFEGLLNVSRAFYGLFQGGSATLDRAERSAPVDSSKLEN